jgi:hypothetical protein
MQTGLGSHFPGVASIKSEAKTAAGLFMFNVPDLPIIGDVAIS